MTTAMQRKPNTPLTKFFALGQYEPQIPVKNTVIHQAIAGVGARISQRNPSPINGEMNVKPITGTDINYKSYNPRAYLNPSFIINTKANLKLEMNLAETQRFKQLSPPQSPANKTMDLSLPKLQQLTP